MENFIRESGTSYPNLFVSSPLFPLLYLSLYFGPKHAPKTTKTILSKYDYIIVGAGSAGATLAARLSEKQCVTVLLLEAGKAPTILTEIPAIVFQGTDLDWNYKTAPQKHILQNKTLHFPLGKAIGGSSIINAMIYVRGSGKIFDKWQKQGATGWSYGDLLPYFKKMENNKNQEDVDIPFHGFTGPVSVESRTFNLPFKSEVFAALEELGYSKKDINGRIPTGIDNLQTTTKNGRRCSVAKAYLVPAENRPNLHIVEDAFVTKIIFKRKQAIGVQFKSKGKLFNIKALNEIIISAGAVHTSKILMLSGIGPKEQLNKLGIHVVANLPVGLNFQDHVAHTQYYYSNKIPQLDSIARPSNIMQFINRGEGLLTNAFNLLTAMFATEKENISTSIPAYQYIFSTVTEAEVKAILKQEANGQIEEQYENKSWLSCWTILLRPKSRGSVSLGSSDPYSSPKIDPNYLADPEDKILLKKGLKLCDEVVKTKFFKDLKMKHVDKGHQECKRYDANSDEYLNCKFETNIIIGYHPVGTAKMGNIDDPTTVVDSELRVKGIKSLRVVDASIMPIIPAGNTNALVIAVAEKAADIIKREIHCKEPL